MYNNCGIFAKFNRSIPKVFKGLSISARADEPKPDPAPVTQPQVNYEDLIKQARKEEKDKLYPRIEKAEKDLRDQVAVNNDLLLKNAALSEEVAKLKKKSGEPDPKVAELEAENQKLKDRIKELEDNTPSEDDIRAKVEKEYEVKLYAQRKRDELKSGKKVLSMLLDDIKGSTNEEVDAAAEEAIKKTKSVRADLGLDDEDEEGEDTSKKKKKKETTKTRKVTRAPAVNPSSSDDEEFDAEYIRSLDPRSDEYKEFRAKLGLR